MKLNDSQDEDTVSGPVVASDGFNLGENLDFKDGVMDKAA
jgi:hypothetical protein